MAAARMTREDEAYKEVLTCPICLGLLINPKVTPCMHTICCGCLDDWIKAKDKPKCPCPVCAVEFEVPEDGAKALKGNYILNDMLDALRKKLEKTTDITEQHCDICASHDEKVKAAFKCIDCDQFICETCNRAHRSIRAAKDHKVIPITGDDKKDINATLEMFPKRMKFCESHPDEPLKFYCTGCCEILCRDCCITTHSGHKCEDLTHNVKEDVKNIGSLIAMAEQRDVDVKAAIQEMNEYKEIIEINAAAVKKAINVTRKVQHDLIDQHYDNQVTEVEKFKHETLKNVDAHINNLELQNGITMSTKHLLETQQQFGHPAQIISMRKELKNKIQEWSKPQDLEFEPKIRMIFNGGKTTASYHQKNLKLQRNTITITASGLDFGRVTSLGNTLKQQVQIKTRKKLPDNLWCVRFLENGDIVSAHDKGGINITDPITHKLKHHVQMECIRLTTQANHIIAVDRDTNTIKQLDEKGNFERNIDCIKPCVDTVAAAPDGKLIVNHGTDQLSLVDTDTNTVISTHNIKADGYVPRLSMTSRCETIVSYYKLNIVEKYSKDGELLFTYNGQQDGEYELKGSRDVYVDPFDRVIVASKENNTVHLLDPKGKFIKLLVTPEDNIQGPRSVAMDRQNHLIVGTWEGRLHSINYMSD